MMHQPAAPKLTLCLVTLNAMRSLPDVLRSIARQSYPDMSLLLVDNYSEDETISYVLENFPRTQVLRNMKNLGLAKACNAALRLSRSEYIAFLDQDMVLEPDTLLHLVRTLERDERIGVCGGRVLQESEHHEETAASHNIIESAGFSLLPNREVMLRGFGQPDAPAYHEPADVFGFPLTLCVFRRSALEDVAVAWNGSMEHF